jgi:hypothetical protein
MGLQNDEYLMNSVEKAQLPYSAEATGDSVAFRMDREKD